MVSLPPPPPIGGNKPPTRVTITPSAPTSPVKPSRGGLSPKVGIYISFGLALTTTAMSIGILIVAGDSLGLRVLGYVLGGIIGPVALGIQTVAQRSALRDPNFTPMYKIGLATKILAFAGIAAAIFMILLASTQISEYITETLERAGWQL